MKKFFLFAVFFLPSFLFAEAKNSLSLLSEAYFGAPLFIPTEEIEYERKIGLRSSLSFSAGTMVDSPSGVLRLKAVSASASYRFYLNKEKAFRGAYLGGNIKFVKDFANGGEDLYLGVRFGSKIVFASSESVSYSADPQVILGPQGYWGVAFRLGANF